MSLHTPIAQLPGMRSDYAQKFKDLGLDTLHDALFYFPFRHEDWRQRQTIDQIHAGQDVTLLVSIARLSSRRGWKRHVSIVEARVTDASHKSFYIVWYNQPYMMKTLKVGDHLYISGTVTAKDGKLLMSNPTWERPSDNPLHEKLVPIYRSIEGLSQRQIRKVIKQAVALSHLVTDPLPNTVLTSYNLQPLPTALEQIHFPDSPEHAATAVQRLKFDELLAWQLGWQREQQEFQHHQSTPFPLQEIPVRSFVQSLPFQLTTDQRVATWEILQDIAKPQPMSRLLQGDVGSGKTVVAAIAAYNVAKQSAQVALLAPTILLAEQHYQTFAKILAGHNVTIALLTGKQAHVSTSDTALSANELATLLRSGHINIIIGTHALIQEHITFANLGLVIVDEQQRFGVQQRDALLQKGNPVDRTVPHFLSLTATPIPRTLALFVAGELTITTLHHKPADRAKIVTEVIGPKQRSRVAAALVKTVTAGQQVFIITPLIEESDTLGARAATVEYERLKKLFPKITFGLVHGGIPAAKRLEILDQFRQKNIDVLVGTTVLEVGLDIPNATLMVIEGAERFGLAQLHQLRGRVGRGTIASLCFLMTDQASKATGDRLQQVADIDDGFQLSELDLQERGAGEIYGVRQSGLPDWRLATLADGKLLTMARTAAQELLTDQAPSVIAGLINNTDQPGVRHRE